MSVDERTLLLDENLPGPLYSLPPVRSGLPRPSAYPCPPEENLNSHRQPSELELLSYKALWNADRPIHILPPELLIEIFTYLLWPDTGSRRPWTRLMCVCRHWCALIRNAPAFWTDIWATDRSWKWFELSIRRARKALICVDISGECGLEETIAIVVAHANHIRKLHVCVSSTSSAPLLEPIVTTSFPHLHDLKYSSLKLVTAKHRCPQQRTSRLTTFCLIQHRVDIKVQRETSNSRGWRVRRLRSPSMPPEHSPCRWR